MSTSTRLAAIIATLLTVGQGSLACTEADEQFSASDFRTVDDFIKNPWVMKAWKEMDALGLDRSGCWTATGVPDVTGIYQPYAEIVACKNCSTIGVRTSPTQMTRWCSQANDTIQGSTGTDWASGTATNMLLRWCPEISDDQQFWVTALGVTEGVNDGCSMVVVNIQTHTFMREHGASYYLRELDVIVGLGEECEALGVTSKIGDWFYWEKFQPRGEEQNTYWIAFDRLEHCPGDTRPPFKCMCVGNDPCADSSDCEEGFECGQDYFSGLSRCKSIDGVAAMQACMDANPGATHCDFFIGCDWGPAYD